MAWLVTKDSFGGQGFSTGSYGASGPHRNWAALHTGGRGVDRATQLRPQQEAGTLGHAQNGEGEIHCLAAMPYIGRADTEGLMGKMQALLGNASSFLLSLSLFLPEVKGRIERVRLGMEGT